MATETAEWTKPAPIPCPEVWQHTHTINGVPVMRVEQPYSGRFNPQGKFKGFPHYYTEERKQVYLCGHKPIPVSAKPLKVENCTAIDCTIEEAEPIPNEVYDSVVQLPEAHDAFEGAQLELLDVDVAQAVLRASAWPIYAEATGYAETLNGCSATVQGFHASGAKIVRVCVPGREGGNFVDVLVPNLIAFQIAEDTK